MKLYQFRQTPCLICLINTFPAKSENAASLQWRENGGMSPENPQIPPFPGLLPCPQEAGMLYRRFYFAPDTGGEGGGTPPEKNEETKTEDAEAMKAELEALRKEKAEREKKAEEERQARMSEEEKAMDRAREMYSYILEESKDALFDAYGSTMSKEEKADIEDEVKTGKQLLKEADTEEEIEDAGMNYAGGMFFLTALSLDMESLDELTGKIVDKYPEAETFVSF